MAFVSIRSLVIGASCFVIALIVGQDAWAQFPGGGQPSFPSTPSAPRPGRSGYNPRSNVPNPNAGFNRNRNRGGFNTPGRNRNATNRGMGPGSYNPANPNSRVPNAGNPYGNNYGNNYGPTPPRPTAGGFSNPLYGGGRTATRFHSQPTVFGGGRPTFDANRMGHVYGAPNIAPGSVWKNAQLQLRNTRNPAQAHKLITQSLGTNRNLTNLMTAVSIGQQANLGAKTIGQYRSEAMTMARQQIQSGQANTSLPYVAMAKFSLEDNNTGAFRTATADLMKKYPNDKHSRYFNGIKLLQDKDWKGAQAELQKARALGMSEESIADLLRVAIDNQKWIWEFAYVTFAVIGAWLIGLGLIFVTGTFLSKATLNSLKSKDPDKVAGSQRLIRRAYGGLISFASVYYYVSLPIVILLAVALPLSVGYALLHLPYLNIVLIITVLVAGLGGVITASSGLRTSLFRIPEQEIGRALTQEEAPRLWQLSREVAEQVGTRPIDEIRIMPTADLAVQEKGSFWKKLRNRGKRILLLGSEAIEGMPVNAFKSVLAHEYGHFLNRDTAGGHTAMRVQNSMYNFADAIVARGKIRSWDVAVHFLRIFHWIFTRIGFGASRLQEVMADRVAVKAYGPLAFETGLTHVIRRSISNQCEVSKEMSSRLCGKNQSPLIDEVQGFSALEREEIEAAVKESINTQSSQWDTHPSPKERFELNRRVKTDATPQANDEFVWELFNDSAKAKKELSNEFERLIEGQADYERDMSSRYCDFLTDMICSHPDPALRVERARVYVDLGEPERAVKDLDAAKRVVRKDPDLLLLKALLLKRLNRYDDAEKSLGAAFDVAKMNEEFSRHFNIGICRHQRGDLDKALESYNAAIQCDGTSYSAFYRRSVVLKRLGQLDEALKDLNSAIELCNHSPEAYLMRGRLHRQLNQSDRAVQDFETALKLDPTFELAKQELSSRVTRATS